MNNIWPFPLFPSPLSGSFSHTLHIHVNPYQITYVDTTADNNYFQVGDWHDVLNIFGPQTTGTLVKIRFWADRYTGYTVLHCHILSHEDQGMLNTYLFQGTEGTVVDTTALKADPLCRTGNNGQGFTLKWGWWLKSKDLTSRRRAFLNQPRPSTFMFHA